MVHRMLNVKQQMDTSVMNHYNIFGYSSLNVSEVNVAL
jgi:hypothetical protein